MLDKLKQYKKRIIAAVAVLLLALASYFNGADVQIMKAAEDAFKGEVTDQAQILEDSLKDEPAPESTENP